MEEKKIPGQSAATASLVLGIIGVVLWFFGFSSILSVILGIIGLVQANKAKKAGFVGGNRTAGFVLSLISLIGGAIVFIIYLIIILSLGAIGILGAISNIPDKLVITNGLTYIALLLFIAGGLLTLQRTTKWKIFDIVPPLVWIYVIHMVLCTLGIYESDAVKATYSGFKNNLLYAMIFVMLLRCDFRKLSKLGGRMIAIFLGCSITLAIGTIAAYPIFMNSMGGGESTWAAVAALYASWVGGSGNMAAMEVVFEQYMDYGAYGAALALDTVCYSIWIALLLLAVKFAPKWNKACKADTSKLDAVAEAANAEVAGAKKQATAADWIFLFGISLLVSAICQWLGGVVNGWLCNIGLDMFGSSTVTTILITILGLICAMTPMGKMAGVEEMSSVYLYLVVSMLASRASLVDLITAPMWVVYGFVILAIHVVLMFGLSKLFKWDLCMVSTASLANIGGSASAPIVATAYNPNFAGIGVLMGVLGAAVGNFFGIGMGAILQGMVGLFG